MRLPTRLHGVLDYLVGALIIASPWLFDFARGGIETWVPVGVGASAIGYSLLTDYELGVLRRLSMSTHLMLDGLGGAFLAVSPWLFGFDQTVWMPHVFFGVFQIVAATLTDTIPRYERRRPHPE